MISDKVLIITILCGIAAGLIAVGIQRLKYKKSIVFTIAAIVVFPIVLGCAVGLILGARGVFHFFWGAPLIIVSTIVCLEIIAKLLLKPLKEMVKTIELLSEGDVDVTVKKYLKGENELAQVMRWMIKLIGTLKNIAIFAGHVGKGELNAKYDLVSDHDSLGKAMLEMRANLLSAEAEKEVRRKEDDHRNWATQGVAKFADLLRTNNDNIDELCHLIVSNLVKYIDANQAGIFILNDDEAENHVLELKACYAYERRKFIEKTIKLGEGIVGTCFLERESIYMTQLPENYIHITSGLGNDTPRALLVTPLKINEEIYGVLEIAAFKEFEPYVREFVEKVAESIASTIGAVKVSIRTNKLLEISKMQREEMANQEEELRQNMEEMQATQEEMFQKQEDSERTHAELVANMAKMEEMQESLQNEKHEIQSVMSAVDHILIRISYGADMALLDLNDAALEVYGYPREQMIGSKLTDRMRAKDIAEFKVKWASVLYGGSYTTVGTSNTKSGERKIWHSYSPIKDAHGNVQKVIMLGRLVEE